MRKGTFRFIDLVSKVTVEDEGKTDKVGHMLINRILRRK